MSDNRTDSISGLTDDEAKEGKETPAKEAKETKSLMSYTKGA